MEPLRELVDGAAAAVRRALPAALPRWSIASRFGADFLLADGPRPPLHELALPRGAGRLLARVVPLHGEPLLALEVELRAPSDELPRAAALQEALPLLIAGALGLRGTLHLLAGVALAGTERPPLLAAVRDWLRLSDEDPLRHFEPAALGARYPDLRGAAAGREWATLAAVLARHGGAAPAVVATRRGPSGATDAEFAAAGRLGADAVAEGCAAEWVAARHQGLAFLPIVLLLDAIAETPSADPGLLAARAATLLPRLAALLPELFTALAALPASDSELPR